MTFPEAEVAHMCTRTHIVHAHCACIFTYAAATFQEGHSTVKAARASKWASRCEGTVLLFSWMLLISCISKTKSQQRKSTTLGNTNEHSSHPMLVLLEGTERAFVM